MFTYHPEDMRRLLDELCETAGVQTLLHTRVVAAYRTERRLTTVVSESASGRQAWQAPVFVDCTGAGYLGAAAGCGWDFGRGDPEGTCQPMTLNALAVVNDAESLADCISFYQGRNVHLPAVENFRRELERAGCATSYGHPTLFQARGNLLTFMINHEYGIKPFDAAQVSAATIRARAEVHRVAAGLRALGGRWDHFQVVATAEQIGVRDGRRLHGLYTVVRDDLVAGRRHPDAVARVTFPVDIHAATLEENRAETISHGNMRTLPYDLPLRALIARDVDGLLMAGRCISGDFIAHASYRVTGNAVAMGEAAGVTAALAARHGRLPQDVPWDEVAATLRQLGRDG